MANASTSARQSPSAGPALSGVATPGVVLKIVQLNLNKRVAASPVLAACMTQQHVQVALLQEQHVALRNGKPTGFPQGMRVYSNEAAAAENKAAIVINDPDIEVVPIAELTNNYGTCIWTKGAYGELIICSMYCKYGSILPPYMRYLEDVTLKAGRTPLLVGMDANARSRMWHSKIPLNRRGHEAHSSRATHLEDLILRHCMHVINEPSQWFSFTGARGVSDIDVTLGNVALSDKFDTLWEVRPDLINSDHNLLSITLSSQTAPEVGEELGVRWNTKGADWRSFREKIRTAVGELESDQLSAEQLQRALDNIIEDACGACFHKERTLVSKMHRWWTPELGALRKQSRRLRVLYQRARQNIAPGAPPTPEAEECRRAYRRVDRQYSKLIRSTKAADWQRFVSQDGNINPWGAVYRMCRGKASTAIGSMRKADGTKTITWADAAEVLLQKFLPARDTAEEIPSTDALSAQPEYDPITEGEVAAAFGRFNIRRAPGLDGKRADVYKNVFQAAPQIIVELFNKCLSEGHFPTEWKEGKLVAFLKSPSRDRADAGSYRPITLLSVLAKAMERVLVNRLQTVADDPSPTQFGFKAGMSTVDAWIKAKELVAECREYAVGIFVDFKGAFDHLNWGSIIRKLHSLGCKEIAVWRSFFSDRRSCMQGRRQAIWRELTRGCPQGSISGPIIWNIMMNELLATLTAAGVKHVAYADDLLLIVEGSSRVSLEPRCSAVIELAMEWGARVGVEVSFAKTEAMMLRGWFNHSRMPKIIVGQHRVRFQKELKYLGVHVSEGMKFEVHIRETTDKIRTVVGPLRRVLKRDWGLKRRAVRTWVNGLLTPIATYGAVVFHEGTLNSHAKRLMDTQHRVILSACLRTCRTVSTHAMQVLMRTLPWDLEVARQAARFKIRRAMPMLPHDMLTNEEAESSDSLKTLDARAAEIWQRRWSESEKGRATFAFIPVVGRPESDDFDPTTFTLFLITGHGSMNAYLKARTLEVDNPACLCGAASEDWQHILLDCSLYNDLRNLEDMAVNAETRDCTKVLESYESYTALKAFANAVFRRRRQLVPRRRR